MRRAGSKTIHKISFHLDGKGFAKGGTINDVLQNFSGSDFGTVLCLLGFNDMQGITAGRITVEDVMRQIDKLVETFGDVRCCIPNDGFNKHQGLEDAIVSTPNSFYVPWLSAHYKWADKYHVKEQS